MTAAALQIIGGCFVAGLRAGFAFNTWPKMGDRWLPLGAWSLEPRIVNLFDNPTTVQFVHRNVAWLVFFATLALVIQGLRRRPPSDVRLGFWIAAGAIGLQVALGIATLLSGVPVWLASMHQGGAVLVWCALLYICHRVFAHNASLRA
jgi:cytochrome c oxidase assembly protein subunit 15